VNAPSTPGSGPRGDRHEWQRRPFLSLLLRCAAVALPALATLGVAVGLSRALPRPSGAAGVVLWYVGLSAAMLATALIVERGARRLLPLAALLNVSLLFPDEAPRRFAVARRVGSPRALQRHVEELRTSAPESAELSRMQRVLELGAALSIHDRRTRGHSERVRIFTDLLAEEMGLSADDRARLRWASLLHDIGKLMVPAAVLRKPSALSDEEWETVRKHPEEGDRIIAPLRDWLGPWSAAVIDHHERWDGKGYPRGLAGREISLGGRIVAVADSYEVMTAPRPYRRSLGVVAARRELVRCSGSQFDPAVVRAFLNISVGRLWRVVGVGAWVTQFPIFAWVGDLASPAGTAVASGVTAIAVGVAPLIPVTGSPTPTPLVSAVATPRAASAAAPDSTATGPAWPGSPPATGSDTSPPPTSASPTRPAIPGAPPGAGPAPTPPPPSAPTPRATAGPTPAPTATPVPTGPLTISMPATSAIAEDQTYTASGSISDPGEVGWTGTVSYGDGTAAQALTVSGSTFTLQHTYGEECSCTVSVTVSDGGGSATRGTAAVRVGAGSAPVVSLGAGSISLLGAYSAGGSFTDADTTRDHFTATVNYGDGSATESLVLQGSSFTLSHQYGILGVYTVTVTVTDDDGVRGTAQITVTSV
jgi:hypothetical protein